MLEGNVLCLQSSEEKMFATLNLKFYTHSSINYKAQAETLSHTHQLQNLLLSSVLNTSRMQFSKMKAKEKRKRSHSVMSNSLGPHGLQPTRLLCPWDFPANSTGVDFHFLLQEIFPTQGSNPGLPHCRQTLYHLSQTKHRI